MCIYMTGGKWLIVVGCWRIHRFNWITFYSSQHNFFAIYWLISTTMVWFDIISLYGSCVVNIIKRWGTNCIIAGFFFLFHFILFSWCDWIQRFCFIWPSSDNIKTWNIWKKPRNWSTFMTIFLRDFIIFGSHDKTSIHRLISVLSACINNKREKEKKANLTQTH